MPSRKEQVAIVSVIASGGLAVAKFVVGIVIGSLALISDALHSTIDLGATLVTWYAVRVADRPPDEEHHYGHGKVESVAALIVTALLFLLAGGVAVEAVSRLQVGGTPVAFSVVPFVVLAIDMVVNAWRARVLSQTARETKSAALEADSLHFASDFFGSIPVIIGLGFAAYGYYWADSVAALALSLLIAILGFRLGKQTIDALVDTAPAGAAAKIKAEVSGVPGVVDVERVRIRTVGPQNFVDVAVRVPRTLPLERLSALKIAIQQKIAEVLESADVTVSTAPVALDTETVLERVMVIARNRALAVHHITVHAVNGRLLLSLDLEVDGALALSEAHEIASSLEFAMREEFGAEIEVDTHIEPLQTDRLLGADATSARVNEIQKALSEIATKEGHVRDVHNVRVRRTGEGEIVNFHCRVDPSLTVYEVHEYVDTVERGLRHRWPSIKRVIGHAEPERRPSP